MPRVAITITTPGQGGALQPSLQNSDGTNDHFLANNGHVLLEVGSVNAGVTAITFITPGLFGGLNVEDLIVNITNATTKVFGPFAPGIFNQPDGTIFIDVPHNDFRFRAYSLG